MFALDKNIVIAVDNHLFVISFTAGSESGLALVTAPDERVAVQVLRNSGKYNCSPDSYTVIQCRNLGLTSSIRMELLMESYVNALVAFDALSQIAPKEGPRGPEGPDGPSAYEVAVKNGFVGSETDWLISLKASITAGDISRILGYAPVSPAQLDGKVDKLPGKGLSTNDLTDERLAWLDRAQQFYRLSAGETFSDIQNPRYGDICQTTVQDVIPFDNTSNHVTLTVTDPPLYVTCLWPSDIGGLMPSDSGWSVTYNDPDTMSIEFWNIPGGGDLFTRAGTYELYRGTGCPDLLLHRGFVDKLFQYTMDGWIAYPGTLADLTDDSSHRLVTDTQIASWNAKYEKPSTGIPASDLAADALPTGVYTIPITVAEGGWEVDPSITYASVSEAISDGKILAIEPGGEGRVLADYEVQNGTINVFGSFCQMGVIGQLSVFFTDGETPEADFTSVAVPDSLSDLADDSTHRTVTDMEKGAWDAKYTKPDTGIPASDLASGVIPDVSGKEDSSNKVSTLTGYESNTTKYPNCKAVYDAIDALPEPMVFRGTIGTGGDSTTVPSSPTKGDTYKIISGGESLTFSGITGTIKVGDTVIYKNSTAGWSLIPSGDEPSGTVTAVTAGAGLNTTSNDTGTDGGTISSSGTLHLTKSGVTAGTYQGLTVDKYGRVTAASNQNYGTYSKPSGGIPASDLASGVIPTVPVQDVTVGGSSVLSGTTAVIPAIPDAVSANPTVPSGTTPTALTGLKIGSNYYDIEAGGGTVTDVTVGGTSVVNQQGVAEVPEIPEAVQAQEIEIDSAPTANSSNLVTSGGVAAALAEKYEKPSTGIPASDLADDILPVIPTASTIPADGLAANKHYTLGELTGSVAVTLDTTTEVSGQMNIYSLVFTAGATAPTITWPASITKWAGNCLDSTTLAPVITGGNTYEVSIVDGLAVITEYLA